MSTLRSLAELGESLAATKKKLEQRALIGAYLQSVPRAEAAVAARLLIGRVFPESDPRILNLSASSVGRVIAELTGAPIDWTAIGRERPPAARTPMRQTGSLPLGGAPPAARTPMRQTGSLPLGGAVDFGDAAGKWLEHRGHKPSGKRLQLAEVYEVYELLAGDSGAGSRERKDGRLLKLLRRATPLEAKYIVKHLVKEMRVGVSEATVLAAVADVTGIPAAVIRRANQVSGDMGEVVRAALVEGDAGGAAEVSADDGDAGPGGEREAGKFAHPNGAGAARPDGARGQGKKRTGPDGSHRAPKGSKSVAEAPPKKRAAGAASERAALANEHGEGTAGAGEVLPKERKAGPLSGLAGMTVRVGVPLKPMLAQSAATAAELFARMDGPFALEAKLDGARVQVHRQGNSVKLFSRQLSDISGSLPEIVEAVREGLGAQEAILDGEVIAVTVTGRPRPFQDVMRRFGRERDIAAQQKEIAVRLVLFDVLQANGQSCLDMSNAQRWTLLQKIRGTIECVRRTPPEDVAAGERFLRETRAAGHEGLVAKQLASHYVPGERGRHWIKLKPVMTLDLVIVAADWGYGRRTGWLSNVHLAARDAETGELFEVGKTFKGLTDAELKTLTERLLADKLSEQRGTVRVKPAVVVEVAFNNVQHSPRYPGGVALRLARIVNFRPDKPPEAIDTIQSLRALRDAERGAPD